MKKPVKKIKKPKAQPKIIPPQPVKKQMNPWIYYPMLIVFVILYFGGIAAYQNHWSNKFHEACDNKFESTACKAYYK